MDFKLWDKDGQIGCVLSLCNVIASAYIPQQKPILYLFVQGGEEIYNIVLLSFKYFICLKAALERGGPDSVPVHVRWIPYLKSIQRNSQLA